MKTYRPTGTHNKFNLAGRIVEKVTGLTYQRAVASLVFDPLGMAHSFFARDDTGAVVGVDLAGRLFRRVPAAAG
jgi:CubicO group peptidase (beta-lactamase class C family)